VEPTVPNLVLRENDALLAPGDTTDSPIISWDPVPGAASYDVQLVPHSMSGCNWSNTNAGWQVATAATAWTPLATGGTTPVPPKTATSEFDKLDPRRQLLRPGPCTDWNEH